MAATVHNILYTTPYIILYLYLLQLSSCRWALVFETCTCRKYCEKIKLNLIKVHVVGLHHMITSQCAVHVTSKLLLSSTNYFSWQWRVAQQHTLNALPCFHCSGYSNAPQCYPYIAECVYCAVPTDSDIIQSNHNLKIYKHMWRTKTVTFQNMDSTFVRVRH
jgi:hypothetical protein